MSQKWNPTLQKFTLIPEVAEQTRESLGLATDDTVIFANLSGNNTGDQDLSGLLPNSHLTDFTHSDIAHTNRSALDLVSGSNTGDQTLPTRDSLGLDTDDTVTFANLSGTNTGDEDLTGLVTLDQTTAQTLVGSPLMSYVEKTATYTITASDYTIDCTANTFTVTLPTAVGITGRIYNIKNSGTGEITVEGDGTETVDGNLNLTLSQYDGVSLQSTGSNWIII